MRVKKGDWVVVEYTGTLDDGSVFDCSDYHDKPLEFEVGAKQVIPGFDEAVMDMEKDQEKEFTVDPAKAYGDHNPELIQKVPRDKIPGEVKPGMILMAGMKNGQKMPLMVRDVSEDTIILDLNHPLAGKNLTFKIKIAEIS